MGGGLDCHIVLSVELPDAQTHEHYAHGKPSEYADRNNRFECHARFRRIGIRLRITGLHEEGDSFGARERMMDGEIMEQSPCLLDLKRAGVPFRVSQVTRSRDPTAFQEWRVLRYADESSDMSL